MNKAVKRYDIQPGVTKEMLLRCGFEEGGWNKCIEQPKVRYYQVLEEDIELHIEISVKNKEITFDDERNIFVFDDEVGQLYYPFYYGDSAATPYIQNIFDLYEKKMDVLVEKGIFQKREKEKVKEKQTKETI